VTSSSVDPAPAFEAEYVDETVRPRGPWRQALSRFARHRLGVGALAILVVIFVVGFLADRLAPYPPDRAFLELINQPQPPLTHGHLLGTDVIGHDFMSQLLFAIKESVVSALVCAFGATVIGVVVGGLAGYYGGTLDAIVSWLTGVVVSVPAVAVLLLVVIFRWPVSPFEFGLWLMLYLWTSIARVVRGAVSSLRAREYVEAAHAAGASSLRVMLRHLFPNTAGVVIVAATSLIGQSIVIVATVDYLGFGTEQAEMPTLGSLVADAARGTGGNAFAVVQAPWWTYVFPAIVLVLMLVCINFVGDSLDDALNPRTSL
jgi:peptide/nickel transport system permease protein